MPKNTRTNTASKKLTALEIIEYCKTDMGLTFHLMNEEDAKRFLEKHNYFFRLKQYAETCTQRTKSGKYIGLDFGHLVELSTIDMFFRKLILKMTIDLEHYLKVYLVNECQKNAADDGYEVVHKFLDSNAKIKEGIAAGARLAGYSGVNFDKYVETPAVWNFVEMINFYDFINFYTFYYDYFKIACGYSMDFDSVRRLRNAAAHNICMLCSFKPVQNFKYDVGTSFELLQSNIGIGNGVIASCMKVPLLNDFTVMLSVYTKLITSPKIKEMTLKEMAQFFDGRMIYHKHYFKSNTKIKNAYQFARKVLAYYSER
ncbi:MAG: Abi family protein [Treponema sp.]